MTFGPTAGYGPHELGRLRDGGTTTGGDQPATDFEAEREEEQDYDLLTFGQAGARLAEELYAERRRLAVLEGGGGSDEAVESSRQRVQALLEAQRRNRRTPFNDNRFEQFFGYAPPPSDHHASPTEDAGIDGETG